MASSYHNGKYEHKPEQVIHKTRLRVLTSEEVGILQSLLSVFTRYQITLTGIHSTPHSVGQKNGWEFDLEFNLEENQTHVPALLQRDIQSLASIVSSSWTSEDIPWFPMRIQDLDLLFRKVKSMGEELDADHPGFTDAAYRSRRLEVCNLAKAYKNGMPIPRIEYYDHENATWNLVYTKLRALYETHACESYRRNFMLLEQMGIFSPTVIPQLETVSNFLSSLTGWSIRPVTGLLTARDFLNALAFRVFHSTQYIRHSSKPMYTPEPDVCHELLGHVPLLADPDFADFSHEVGLASLGASDSEIDRLATVYWFTVEFGLCKEGTALKAYGAGLLSSFGELEYCLTDAPRLQPFDPSTASSTAYPITEFQPLYFVADSFEVMKRQIRWYSMTLTRPFPVHYNPYTRSVEILDSRDKLHRFSVRIQQDFMTLMDSLKRN